MKIGGERTVYLLLSIICKILTIRVNYKNM